MNKHEQIIFRAENNKHQEADNGFVFAEQFFASHNDFFRHYAGDASIKIKPASEAPVEVKTMAIDLANGVMYVNPVFFSEKEYSLDKANFGVMHEFEHFLEIKDLLSENNGEQIWNRHSDKLKKKKRYAIFDNCFDDIKMNRSVLQRTPVLEATEQSLYKENLFTNTDFTKLPRHLQFSYALLREARVPDEITQVSPEVRAKIDELKNIRQRGVDVIDFATSPLVPMSMRLKVQERFFEKIIDEFFEQDVDEKKSAAAKAKADKEEQAQKNENKEDDKGDDGDKDEEGDENNDGDKSSSENAKPGKNDKPGKPDDGQPGNGDGEEYFSDEYADYDEKNPQAMSIDDIAKAVQEYLEAQKGGKSVEQMANEAYAQAQGVKPGDIEKYRSFWQQIEAIVNPESGEQVIEKLRAMFKRIINERKQKKFVSKYPTDEGEILAFPAEAVVATRQGEREPKVWETVDLKEKPREMYGDFDVTVVADRSGSMKGEKAIEQRKAVALILEALKDFCDELDEANKDIEYDLNVRTEAWSFGDEKQVEILKPLSKELTEKERVHVYQKLAETPGNSTFDFSALEKIYNSLSSEDLEKLRSKKLKKIIIVTTDGDSDDSGRLKIILQKIRETGISVVGIGITKSGQSAKTAYAPDGQVCERSADLAVVLGDLLKKELQEL